MRTQDIAFARLLLIVASAFALAAAYFVAQILDPKVTLPLVSWTERMVLASVLGSVAAGFWLAMTMYLRRLVIRVRASQDGRYLHVTRPTWRGHREEIIPCRDIQGATLHGGDVAGEDALNAPWLSVKVKDRPLMVLPISAEAGERAKLLSALQLTSNGQGAGVNGSNVRYSEQHFYHARV